MTLRAGDVVFEVLLNCRHWDPDPARGDRYNHCKNYRL